MSDSYPHADGDWKSRLPQQHVICLRNLNSRPARPQAKELRRGRRRLLDAADKHGVGKLRVFGSLARGEAEAANDVDLKPGRTLIDLAAFRREAAEILKLPVDVATPDMLKGRIHDEVLNEALPL